MARFAYKNTHCGTGSYWKGSQLDHATFTEHLNELGEHGWELVNVFDLFRHRGGTCEVIAVFKQPLE